MITDTLTNRIRRILEGSPGEPWTPYEISKITGGIRGSVSKILSRLRSRGDIQQYRRGKHSGGFRGFYTYNPEIHRKEILEGLEKREEIHNFKIFIEKPIIEIQGSQYQKLSGEILQEIQEKIPGIEIKENQKWIYCYHEMGPSRNLTIGISKTTGSIQLWLKCGNNPLPLGDFHLYIRFMEVLFSPWWNTSNTIVQQLEINQDIEGINVNGFSNLTIQQADKEILQIYNKGNSLRNEKRYILDDLSTKSLAYEFSKHNEKSDNLVQSARITDLRNEIQTLKETVQQMGKENKDLRGDLRDLISSINTMVQGSAYSKDPDLFTPFQTADKFLDGDPPGYG